VETFETIISFKDGNTGVARDLNRAATRAAVKNGEKSVAAAFLSIQDMCDTISLPRTVTDIAKQLYRRADEGKLKHTCPSPGLNGDHMNQA
jgi:transcription initiation factor TFIIB